MPLSPAEINELARQIQRIIWRPIAWIASNVADFGPARTWLGVSHSQYIRRETVGCGRLIAEWLTNDPEVAPLLEDRSSDRLDWLYREVLGSHPEKANGFRSGRLFKLLAGPQDEVLHAGFVLTCKRPGCPGEIQFDDRCFRCGHIWSKPLAPEVDPAQPCPANLWHEPAWRLWFEGQRGIATCRRCLFCGGLFFQCSGLDPATPPGCPGCHKTRWSPRTTDVYVRRRMMRAAQPAEIGLRLGSSSRATAASTLRRSVR